VLYITVEAEADMLSSPQIFTREQTMPHKTDRENRVTELTDQLDRLAAVCVELRDEELAEVSGGGLSMPRAQAERWIELNSFQFQ
jgi:hypothetical protein